MRATLLVGMLLLAGTASAAPSSADRGLESPDAGWFASLLSWFEQPGMGHVPKTNPPPWLDPRPGDPGTLPGPGLGPGDPTGCTEGFGGVVVCHER